MPTDLNSPLCGGIPSRSYGLEPQNHSQGRFLPILNDQKTLNCMPYLNLGYLNDHFMLSSEQNGF
jgi:hypothetical protein